jgi:hypothetical protein
MAEGVTQSTLSPLSAAGTNCSERYRVSVNTDERYLPGMDRKSSDPSMNEARQTVATSKTHAVCPTS